MVNIFIPVLYANMRSINPANRAARFNEKIQALHQIIENHRPVIIAIVETWLTDRHENVHVSELLGLQNYIIWRQDRDAGHPEGNAYEATTTGMEGRRGGGILLAWRNNYQLPNGFAVRLERNSSEDIGDCILSADILAGFSCQNCGGVSESKFGFTIVYRRPAPITNELDDEVRQRLTHMIAVYNDELTNYTGWSFVGDYNFVRGPVDPSVEYLVQFALEGTTRFPEAGTATHVNGNCLDLVIASAGHFGGGEVSQEPISDHHAISYTLNLGNLQDELCDQCDQ